ncbi:hypothetical protein CBS101457_006456 [Exobasidium rhododendri]|nr:hypothetical protein CBS101457_006456 [Exobasidium rhododendri]
MPSAFNLFKSNSKNSDRRSSNVSFESTRSAISKSLASLSSSASSSGTAREDGSVDTPVSSLRRSSFQVQEAAPKSSKPTPSISTSGASFKGTDRPASVPSIDITSPSSDTPKPLWVPEEEDPGNRITPSPSLPFSVPQTSNTSDTSSEEDVLFTQPEPSTTSSSMPRSPSAHSKYRSEPGGGGGGSMKKSGNVPDRHDVMRRAMADATNSDSFGGISNDSPSEPTISSRGATSQSPPGAGNDSTIDQGERIGGGSLSFEHFGTAGTGDGEVVHAEGGAGSQTTLTNGITTQEGQSTQGFPSRPRAMNRSNSNQSDSGATEVEGHSSSAAQPLVNQSQPTNAQLTPSGKQTGSHDRYATTGHEANGGNEQRHMHESASTSNLMPSPLARLRKLSDSGSSGKAKANGIAGALAASGMAGMGVGNAAHLQQSQTNLANSKERNLSSGADLSGGEEEGPPRGRYVRDRSTTGSTLSLASSDVSAASGLNAAAQFSTAAAAKAGINAGLLGPEDLLKRGNGESPPLTPGGVGAVGGLSPSGNGERVALGDDEPWPGDMGSQITGFAVASSKRNADFHALFTAVPEDDYLIEDYGCALVREILIQGRIYVSENHICFYANIFGWVTNIVLPFPDIVSIEKRMTAFVIPNAIQIATLHSKQTFASFLSRDTTFDLMVNIWKLSHPGVPTGDSAMEYMTDEESADHDGGKDGEQDGEKGKSDAGDSGPKISKRKLLKKKLGLKESDDGGQSNEKGEAAQNGANTSRGKSPGPGGKKSAHRKTQCPCDKDKKHYSTVALDTTYPAVPEKIYNLIFTSGFMKEFWTENQKLLDLQMADWSPNADNDNMLSRKMSYIKPLSGSFGPKQTKCMLTDDNLHVDFDEYVIAQTTTKTPDVPSGGSFSVKTRTCFTWAGGNVTKVFVTCQVEWTGRSMVKGIIDRASIDGQKQYYKDLDVAIRKYIKEHISEFREEGDDETSDEAIASGAEAGDDNESSKEGAREPSSTEDGEAKAGFARVVEIAGDVAGTVFDTVSNGVGTLSDMAGGVSPSVLILGFVVVLLLVSNLWASRSPSSRDPQDPHRLRHSPKSASKSSYRDHYEPEQAQVVANAVRDVLRDYFEPGKGGPLASARIADNQSPRLTPQDPQQETQTLIGLLDEIEGRVALLRDQLRQVSQEQATPDKKRKR